jgi:metal-dependent hydrolase (beta-lactamase superfamily II)
VKVTIVYDNETWKPGLEADWGFACLVEDEGRRWLFDTGAKGEVVLEARRQGGRLGLPISSGLPAMVGRRKSKEGT